MSRRKAPANMAAVRKSRACYTGAVTKAFDKLKLIKSDEVEAIAVMNIQDVEKHLRSAERTESNFNLSLDEAQEFAPDGEEEDETFQEEENSAADAFDDSMVAIKNMAAYLLSLKSVQVGLADLTYDITSLETTLGEEPDSDHTSTFTTIEAAFSELRLEWRKANLPKEHPLKEELDACKKSINTLSANTAKAKRRASPTPTSRSFHHSDSPPRMDRDKTKLPAIALPVFKGDILQWPTFWRKFSAAVDTHEGLPDSTKLTYLRTAIQDPEAEIILNPSVDGPCAYKRLVKELHQRYKRTKKIHREMVEKIINLPNAKHNSKDLRRFVDSVNNCVDCLNDTGHFTIETFISSLLYNKLPYKMQIDWDNDHHDDDTVAPFSKLLEYVSKKTFTLADHTSSTTTPVDPPERRSSRKPEKRADHQPPKQKSHIYSVSSPVSAPTYKWECFLCRPEKHPLHSCPKWGELSVAQRLTHVKEKKLCSNCLAIGHLTANCKSTYRCRDCGQAHHTSIHQTQATSVQVSSTLSQSQQLPDALLMTAEVLLKGPGGHEMKARAFLDPGAGVSLISSRVVQILELPTTKSKTSFSTVQETECQGSHQITSVIISPLHKKMEIHCTPAVVKTVTGEIPNKQFAPVDDFPHLIGLQLADPNFNTPGRVDILLGVDVWLQVQGKLPTIKASSLEPGAQDTIFGWAITGPVKAAGQSSQSLPTYHLQNKVSNEDLYNLAYEFWLREGVEDPQVPVSLVEAQVQQHFETNFSYSPSQCRYQVALPRIPDHEPLGESRPQAVQRFFATEKISMARNEHPEVIQQFQGYLDAGHAEKVPYHELLLPHFYLPYHCVYKQSSTSTKIRVVFDGSALTSTGVSLNQILQVGPTIQPTLVSTILRFRAKRIAITADIKQMYREVELTPEDRDFHRFIWRSSPQESIQDYRMTRVTFGVSASPYLAIRTLHKTAIDHGKEHPEAAHHLQTSFYVDDFLGGHETVEGALKLYSDMRSILKKGGFNLVKWRSSSPAVLQNIPAELQEKMPIKSVTSLQSAQPKALGLEWNSGTDCMSPAINTDKLYRKTKRGVISDISKTFDVLGWVAPAILPMKVLSQQLWEKGQGWDDPISSAVTEQHSKWKDNLPALSDVHLPRFYQHPQHKLVEQELHGFSDASLKACGAVVYLRSTYENHPPTLALVIGKTKVAKKNPPTIPKLELCGAVLLTKLLNHVASVLQIPVHQINAWTDSSIVLAWLDGRPREFKQFVANRVSFILEHTRPQTWRHVPTQDNPADCASRGMAPQDLVHHELWWKGPSWLYQGPVLVPVQPPRREPPSLEIRIVHAVLVQAEFALNFEQRTNDFHLIISMTAWWFRLFHRLKEKKSVPGKNLTPQELQDAEHWLLKQSQHRNFPKEVQSLHKHSTIAPSSRLRALTPFLDSEGIIRVGGRLSKSSLSKYLKHPIIVDSKDSFIKKLFLSKHSSLGHCGPSLLLCHTGNKLHVLGARKLSRNICRSCVTCRRIAPVPVPQLLGELPISRTQSEQPAFTNTGLDFAGPFTIRQGHTRRPVKIEAHICVFVCMATKAVHLEVTSDLTTAAFTACLRRFISRRNCPKSIICDNGPNFVGARNELHNIYKFLTNEKTDSLIHQFLLKQQIQWLHIPAHSPHFGGLWESAVRSMKKHLRRLMGTLLLTFEELTTITCQIEACLNSRPLIPMTSHNADGVAALTPGHFLFLNAPNAYPDDPQLPEEPRLLKKWNQCQSVVHHFWSRWSREYLNTLQGRTKWQRAQPNLLPNDVVIIKEDKLFTCHWPLARVISTHPGEDGLVRVATIQAATGGRKKRPVTMLSLLYRPDIQTELPASPGSMFRQEPEQGLYTCSRAAASPT